MNTYKTHIDRIVASIPLPYYWGAAILSAIFFSILCTILILLGDQMVYVVPIILLSTLIGLQITIVLWCENRMELLEGILLNFIELPKEEAMNWYERQKALIFNDKRMIAAGIFLDAFAHLAGLDYFGFSFNSFYSEFVFRIGYYIAHYFVGAGMYMLIATAWMTYRISRLPLNINVILSRNIQFKGTLYSKFTICATSVYLMWGVFYMSTPLRLSSTNKIVWFSSFAILLAAYFILPQYSVRQILIKTRKERLEIFTSKLGAKAEETLRNPTSENTECLKNLLDVQSQLDEMSEWPFGSYELAHIALIIIVPLIVVVLEIMIRNI